MEIQYLSKFMRQYKKLPLSIKLLTEKRVQIFQADPFDQRLKTHKLSGSLDGFLAFSVNNEYRIIFDFGTTKEIVHFYEIGDHDIYD
ncbi:type II toxin-antitoxin system mRNA interferase toxin, RelE/StbE family [Candidatus Kaiserbacteria bacterium]|nr:type II toxin-antitoxin system mRNA interferase toxin, RelE/StbE family [Candidatus Kaiserbacteria bacterium]